MSVFSDISALISYGLQKEFISEYDVSFVRNQLMDFFRLIDAEDISINTTSFEPVHQILDRMLDYAYAHGILADNDITSRDLADTKIINLLLPFPGQIVKTFEAIKKSSGVKAATDYFYQFAFESNYIRSDRISKNIIWQSPTEYGDLEITINLSKPEKDPKAIAAAKLIPSSGYPKCLLCPENVGFAGNLNHPARQNLRILPLELNNEKWSFQYSPFVYYNEHCIILKNSHDPMKLSSETFVRLIGFVDIYPHYFIGSNADLPIVGGSILNHDHFQGGRHEFPMAKAKGESSFTHSGFSGLKAEIVKWPMSVIRLKSKDKNELIAVADFLYQSWQNYSDPANGIYAFTNENGKVIPHNTVTPIVRMRDEFYEIDMVLRNNLTSNEHPFGIFHPHEELHHIKKENIGLIEVMGLAVLPGRLASELAEIETILLNPADFHIEQIAKDNSMFKHSDWIDYLIKKHTPVSSTESAKEIVKNEVALKFEAVLAHCGVFKRDEQGRGGFCRFLIAADFQISSTH